MNNKEIDNIQMIYDVCVSMNNFDCIVIYLLKYDMPTVLKLGVFCNKKNKHPVIAQAIVTVISGMQFGSNKY